MASLYECRLVGKFYGSGWMNVFHFSQAGSGNTTREDMAFSFLSVMLEALRADSPRDVFYSRLEVTEPLNPNLVPLIIPINLTGGGGGDDELYPTVAYILQKRTALTGRANRGRNYIVGVWKGDYKGGVLGPQGQARWNNRLALMRNEYTTGSHGQFIMCVKHKNEGFENVEQLTISTTVGQMRSRNIGVGI